MAADTNKKKDGKAKPKAKTPELTTGQKISRELLSWFWVILAFVFIEGTLVQARVIPSGSMENTIKIGDHLIVSRFGYDAGIPFTDWQVPLWRNPKRQQIIVFEAPLPGSEDFIKRVIGVPGDVVKIDRGVVYVNGKPLDEPYVDGTPDPNDPMETKGPIKVPPHDYFVMGDNRNNSYDSRYWGFVPRKNIIGTPLFIYMSIKAPGEVWEPGHVFERLGTYLNLFIHPSEMRWGRLFLTF